MGSGSVEDSKTPEAMDETAPDNGARGRLKEVPKADHITIRQHKQRKDAVKNVKPKKKNCHQKALTKT